MHIVFILANNSTAPYFIWFAEESAKHKDVDFSFVAMTKTKPLMPEEVEKFGCKGYWIKYDCDKRKRQMLMAVARLYKLFRKIKPDVVHTHLFDDSLPGLLAARLANIKIRAITKGDTAYHYNHTPQWVKFDRFNNWNATIVIAPTFESYDFIKEKEKCPTKKLTMIRTSIPVEHFGNPNLDKVTELKNKYALHNKFVVGTMARFIEWKGYKTVIDVAESLHKKIPNLMFLLMGDGNQKIEIEKLVVKKGLQEIVTFGGWLENKHLPSYYSCLDVFLHAAYMEPGGFVIMEAMAAGIPVVSTPTGSAKDGIQHQVNGWLGEYNNASSLADGIEFFYLNKISKPWKQAQNTATELFNFNDMFNNYILLYKKLKANSK